MHIELPESLINELTERVKKKLEGAILKIDEQSDPKAREFQRRLSSIKMKENISVQDAAFLLNCSDGHIRNLVKKAKHKRTQHPIPYNDLDGVDTFNLEELIAWSRQPKERAKKSQGRIQSEPNL